MNKCFENEYYYYYYASILCTILRKLSVHVSIHVFGKKGEKVEMFFFPDII